MFIPIIKGVIVGFYMIVELAVLYKIGGYYSVANSPL